MSVPKETYVVYYLRSEWLKNRADTELFNSDTFSNAFRRLTMTSAFLYDEKTNKKIGEFSSSFSQVSSLITPFVTVFNNSAINIFDKLIVPQVCSGHIYENGGSFNELKIFYPPRTITQNIYGQKVVILRNPLDEGVPLDKVIIKIEVYQEDA